jgi:hypothetical protein
MTNSASHAVRVSIPVSVAYNIGSLKKAIGEVLNKIGCPTCCSGHDLFFELQREVTFTNDLKSDPHILMPATQKIRTNPTRHVSLQPEFAAKLDHVFSAIDKLAELSGCTGCTSGSDIFFQLERQFVINPALEVRETVATFG